MFKGTIKAKDLFINGYFHTVKEALEYFSNILEQVPSRIDETFSLTIINESEN